MNEVSPFQSPGQRFQKKVLEGCVFLTLISVKTDFPGFLHSDGKKKIHYRKFTQ